jgi:hypothetical protein
VYVVLNPKRFGVSWDWDLNEGALPWIRGRGRARGRISGLFFSFLLKGFAFELGNVSTPPTIDWTKFPH